MLTDEIYKTWSGMTSREYKNSKGLTKESLRDNMSDIEVILTDLGEVTTRDIAIKENPKGLSENIKVARRGGNISKITKELYEKECRVSPDSVLVINKVQYEIHYRYAKQKVRLRYSPDMEKAFVVGPSGDLTPVTLRLLNKHENASVKREKILLSRGGETTT